MAPSRRRIALRLQYDGAAFAGSQWQRGQPTVQAALERATEALTGSAHRVELAGRTDAGVHAIGQVAALTTESALPLDRWTAGLNHFLPAGLAVQAAREVPLHFDPRRDACDRTYWYSVRLANVRQPLWQRRSWVVRGPLDVQRMQDALTLLVGEHDFASFAGKPSRPGTVRTMLEAKVESMGESLRFVLRAHSFLPRQVRLTVGQVVRIGRGELESALVPRLLAEPRMGAAGPAAPAEGLVLARVRYSMAELADWNEIDENLLRS